MLSNKRNLIVIFVALLLPLAYAALRYLNNKTTNGSTYPRSIQELRRQQTAKLVQWMSQPVVPLTSKNLDSAVVELLASPPCMSGPHGTNPLTLNDMTDHQKADLALAITGLLRAYAMSDPGAVFSYMQGRDEALQANYLNRWRNSLVKELGWSKRDADSTKADELFKLAWTKLTQSRTHWKGLITKSGCICIWSAPNSIDQEMSNSLGTGSNEQIVFQNTISHQHCFSPKSESIKDVVEKFGGVTVADVKLVIQYDDQWVNQPTPHYIRFWYEPTQGRWHPLQMVSIATVKKTYPKLLF